jgi:hypothetical protein
VCGYFILFILVPSIFTKSLAFLLVNFYHALALNIL